VIARLTRNRTPGIAKRGIKPPGGLPFVTISIAKKAVNPQVARIPPNVSQRHAARKPASIINMPANPI